MAGCFDNVIGEMGECQAFELMVQYHRGRKMDGALSSVTNNALREMMGENEAFMDVMEEGTPILKEKGIPILMEKATPTLKEKGTPSLASKEEMPNPSDRDTCAHAEEGYVDTLQPIHRKKGTPVIDSDLVKPSGACHGALFEPTPNIENSAKPQPAADLDDLGYSPDTKSLLRRKRVLDSIIKSTLPTTGGENGEKNNSSRGPAFPKKRSVVHRMARELDEKVKLGVYSFVTKPDSAAHIRNYLLTVGQETEVAKVERLPQVAANRAQSDRSSAFSQRCTCPFPRGPAPLYASHDHSGINPIHSAPLIDMVNNQEIAEAAMQGDATGLDPRGHWNRTSSEESTNSEEMDRGRMKKRNKMKESGDSTTKLEDPTLQGVGKGRLSELLKFYEKLEEEALKSGHRSVLFRPPYPCPASKVWKKRSRSCAPKLSATDSAKQRMEPRALSAEDAELCEALERMAGDSDVDESMRTAFLSVIKEIQEQAETDTQPQQGSNDAEQEGEHTGIKRKRSVQFAPSGDEVASTDPKHKKNDSKATQEAEGSCEQENWTDPEQIDLLPCLDSAAPDCQRLLESLEDELMRTSVSPGPQYRGSPRSGSKAERISKVITFVIVLLALASLGSNGVWPLSQLFR